MGSPDWLPYYQYIIRLYRGPVIELVKTIFVLSISFAVYIIISCIHSLSFRVGCSAIIWSVVRLSLLNVQPSRLAGLIIMIITDKTYGLRLIIDTSIFNHSIAPIRLTRSFSFNIQLLIQNWQCLSSKNNNCFYKSINKV